MTTGTFNNNIQAIVLAAGKSSRFKTGKSKLLEKICGQEIILYATKLLHSQNIPLTVVVGFQKEEVQVLLQQHFSSSLNFITQEQQQGTGHAIECTRSSWFADHILIINGDMPLITHDIITALYTKHRETNAAMSFVIAHNTDPSLEGYGRIIKENEESIQIVEAREFTGDSHQHCCINAGIYLIKRTILEEMLTQLKVNALSKEFYFTDIVKLVNQQGLTISTVVAPFDRIRGINTLQELWTAQQIKRAELIRYWMENGVQFSAAQNVHIDLGVTIGAGTRIAGGVHIVGTTSIGINCTIQEFCSLENSSIGDSNTIRPYSIISNSQIGNNTHIGPFAHIHHKTDIHDNTIIGNYVEIKQSIIGQYSKAKHLSYLGDSIIGSHVNIGAGTITCNHNGISKNTTVIQDNAYIGSNNTLIAPITIGSNAFTAAGSVITDDVPAHALALGRARQVNKEDYAQKLRGKAEEQPTSSNNQSSNSQSPL